MPTLRYCTKALKGLDPIFPYVRICGNDCYDIAFIFMFVRNYRYLPVRELNIMMNNHDQV